MNTNWFNYPDFYHLVAGIPHFKIYVEVGVWKGHSISYLANLLRGREVTIYAVDLFEDTLAFTDNEELQKDVKIIDQLYNQTLQETNTRHLITDIKDFSHKAADRFEDKSVDFVFIDASHEYVDFKMDMQAWLPKIKPGGMISGHDYGRLGVNLVLEEMFGLNFEILAYIGVWLKRL